MKKEKSTARLRYEDKHQRDRERTRQVTKKMKQRLEKRRQSSGEKPQVSPDERHPTYVTYVNTVGRTPHVLCSGCGKVLEEGVVLIKKEPHKKGECLEKKEGSEKEAS